MGKKKNAPAGAAAGTSSSKVIGNLKTLNSDLVNKLAELRKQIEQLRSQPDSLTTDRDIADGIERDVSSNLGEAKARQIDSVTKFFDIGVVPGCFLANKNTTDDATLDFEGTKYFLPAWSVSVLPDCKQEVDNTTKVNAQTSIMVKKPNQAEAEPKSLIWSWKPEDLSKAVQGLEPDFTTNTLRDQILASVDASNYLWYITSVNVSQDEQMSLQVCTTGHILHAFVNGDLIGSEYAPNGKFSFVFEKDVVLNQEMNIISLLGATVGLKNYGPYYELMPAGIVGNNNDTIDLSLSRGSYMMGLDGEKQQVYLDNSNSSWNTGGMFPMKVLLTWYKTTFQAPLGSDPVAVDLLGMGKGTAWVNGQSLGRFWPSYLTWVGGCSPCDYRGPFQSNSCQTGCSEPAQRWYHVPRSFLKAVEPNTLVLFEEAIDPSQVNFQTVTVETVCANVVEGKILTWSCPGPQKISALQVASFGDPQSTCGSFQIGSCNVDSAFGLVRQACVGTGDMFGSY